MTSDDRLSLILRRLDEIERKSIRPHIVRDRAVRAWLGEDGGRATLAARLNSGSQPSAELFVLLLETSHSLHAAFFNDKISLWHDATPKRYVLVTL
jgi:hypothetical protein